jgi:ABC-type dipeptide/oligopeptide/nickel transport system permease component
MEDMDFSHLMDDAKKAKTAKAVKAIAVSSVVASFVIPLSGIPLGIISLIKGKKIKASGYKVWAITGIILSSIPIVLIGVMFPFMFNCVMSLGPEGGMCFGVMVNP